MSIRRTAGAVCAAALLGALATLSVPSAAHAASSYTLDVTPDVTGIGDVARVSSHLTANLDRPVEPMADAVDVRISFEAFGDVDGDSPTVPDASCSIPIGLRSCTVVIPAASDVHGRLLAWIDTDHNPNTIEADRSEGRYASDADCDLPEWCGRQPQPGAVPEPDLTDVVYVGFEPDPNTAPIATDDDATTTKRTPVTIDVLANDRDPDGGALTVTGTSTPAHGTATVEADGSVTYQPERSFRGSDTFTYTIADAAGGTDTATVSVTVG